MAIAGTLVVTVTAKTQDFENGMKKTTATLKLTEQQAQQVSQAFGGLGQAMSSMGSKATGASQQTDRLNRSMKDTGGVMADIKGQLTGLIASFVAFSALKAGITSTVDAALKQERLVSILTAVTGSQQKASEAMAFARQEAERFGVELNAATEGYARLLAVTKSTTLEGQRSREMYSNILAVMSTFKVASEDQNDILRATTQILGQQAIQGDELKNEIGSRLPIMQKLVEASNGAFKTQLEFNKAMEDGKLKGEAASAIMYNLFQIMARDATRAGNAGQGAAAEFNRFNNTLTELKETIGSGLLPALTEAARALTQFIQLGKEGAGAFGGAFTETIRQMTSALIGLAGGTILAGKALGMLAAGFVEGGPGYAAGWEDIKQYASDLVDLQTKIIGGGFATKPGTAAPGVGGGQLLPVVPGGGEEKAAKKTAAERESERIAKVQADLVKDITDNLDMQTAIFERGITLEQARLELRIKAAKLGKDDADTLLKAFEETQLLTKLNEERASNLKEIEQTQKTLQLALDKELYTERELLRQKLVSLEADATKVNTLLRLFDRQQAAEATRKKAEKDREDSLKAQADHMEKMVSLQQQLEPQQRYRTRREELVGVQQEMIGEGATEFELAASDVQLQRTLVIEESARRLHAVYDGLENMADELGSTFIDMATTGEFSFKRLADSFARMTLEMVADVLDLKGAIGSWLKKAFNAAGGLFGGGAGGMPTTDATMGAITQTAFGGGGGAFGPEGMSFAFGGGMAAGGPVMPGKFYTVGERGPETLIAGGAGTIVPHGGGGMNVTMNIVTNDANSFRLNERQIAAQSARMLSHARRNL